MIPHFAAMKTAKTEADVIKLLDLIDDDEVDRVVAEVLDSDDLNKHVRSYAARYVGFFRLKEEVGETEARRLIARLN